MTRTIDSILTPTRLALVDRMAAVGPTFAQRAHDHDVAAEFPYSNWDDLKDAGLLGICIPESDGGLGGDFIAYALVAEELGRHCTATALTFNMHVATTLLVGQVCDELTLNPADREIVEMRRSILRQGIVQDRFIHAQPFSEGLSAGATSGYASRAVPVAGGYLVSGRKIFASLSGGADIHNIVCTVEGDPRVRLMGVPAGTDGLTIEGNWDPLGMRATDSRILVMNGAFVPSDHEWIPPGVFDQVAQRWPFFYMTLSFAYVGLMRAILEATAHYLIGDAGPGARREHPIKQQGWAQMNLIFDRTQSLCYRVLGEVGVDPTPTQVRRAWSSMVTTMEAAPEMASLAIRVCGGRSMLRPSILERAYRDARCGATMLPWSVEVCLDRLGRTGLFPDAEASPA